MEKFLLFENIDKIVLTNNLMIRQSIYQTEISV